MTHDELAAIRSGALSLLESGDDFARAGARETLSLLDRITELEAQARRWEQEEATEVARIAELEAALGVIAGGSILSSWKQIAKAQQEIARRALGGES